MNSERQQLEWAALRWLCSAESPPSKRDELVRRILPRATEFFQVQEYRAVLEELAALAGLPVARVRELLPARVTNRGLPELDFRALFAGDAVSDEDARAIQQWLSLA